MVSEIIIRKNRTIFETIEAILKGANSPAHAGLLYRITGVRWDMLLDYLDVCLEKALIETVTDADNRMCFQTTMRGKSYLTQLNNIKEMISYENTAEILMF